MPKIKVLKTPQKTKNCQRNMKIRYDGINEYNKQRTKPY